MKIKDNWNRMAQLTQMLGSISNNSLLTEVNAEISYRIWVQNHFANEGVLPKDYVEVGFTPTGLKSRIVSRVM